MWEYRFNTRQLLAFLLFFLHRLLFTLESASEQKEVIFDVNMSLVIVL